MIKQLKKTDVGVFPFRANKARQLFNVQNPACPILEPYSQSIYEYQNENIALDYVDYLTGTPLLNRDCNIALEQQEDDVAVYEEGFSGSLKPYNSGSDEFNPSGTSKLLLYNQIRQSFYNEWHNPTEIFGMENIDFPLSKTNRYLANDFRMFTIPRFVMGDRIQPGSVQFQDTAFDDNVNIYDDSNGNLIAGDNLFSKVQEIRLVGNYIVPGDVTASYTCPVFYDGPPIFIPNITASQIPGPSGIPMLMATTI
jgi:hypothetical protein